MCLCLITLLAAVQSTHPIEIPFEFYRNQIIIQVDINGQGPFSMLVDTGTDPSAIDLATARLIGLKIKPTGHRVAGGGNEVNLGYETALPDVTVGEFTARNISAIAIDLSKLSEQLGRPAHGVLGHSLLNGRTVQIDYANRRIRFYDGSLLSGAKGRETTPDNVILSFRYHGNILLDNAVVNGAKVTASLDTGSNEAFQITPALVRSLGLQDEARNGQRVPSVGYNGASFNTRGVVESVKIGPLTYNSPAVMFFSQGSGHDNETWGLNIGNAFLKDFVVTIDYRSRLLALARR